ncbi:MAG: hypothetical protein DYH18_04730 [Xanthomonadales bacterium PRO7]|nr:hypothetical protein [Xanthomonadales bacterium PRO7]
MNIGNEFQWRSELRKLGGDVEPSRDLWLPISARIAVRLATQRWRMGLGIAAALIAACGVGAIAWRTQHQASYPTVARASNAVPSISADSAPLAWAMPANPALAAAARDLDAANVQLQRAIEQNPRAVFLVGLLNRTNDQRMRLLRQENSAG